MKKMFSMMLSVLLVFSMLSSVSAETLDENTSAGETSIEYSVGETYTVVIPEEIVVAKDTETPVEYSVVVKDLLIPYGSSLDVSVEYEGKLKLFEHSATTLGYQIVKSSDSSVLSNGGEVISVPAGTVEEQSENLTAVLTETPIIAGNYEDIATFKINVDSGESQYGEAIQMWEISATENDDVWMTYYQPEVASTYSARTTTTNIYEDGTVYITGTGDMEDNVYTYFINEERVLESVESYAEKKCGFNVTITKEADYEFKTFASLGEGVTVLIDDESAGDKNNTAVSLSGWNSDGTQLAECYNFIPKAIVVDEGVTNISELAFMGSQITSLTLPSTIETLDYGCFALCQSLTNVSLPEGLKIIGNSAFVNSALETITIPSTVENIEMWAFIDCVNLKDVTFLCDAPTVGEDAFYGTVWTNNLSEGPNYINSTFYSYVGTITESETIVVKDGTKKLAHGAFYYQRNLTSVVLPESLELIDDSSFYGCSALTTITIPKNVTSISESAFKNSGLTTVNGVAGSYAETFASNNGYTFVEI